MIFCDCYHHSDKADNKQNLFKFIKQAIHMRKNIQICLKLIIKRYINILSQTCLKFCSEVSYFG